MQMSTAWLTYPLLLDGSRSFDCMDSDFTAAQCEYYTQRWHFWFQADLVYAIPTVAFFMCTIGIFIIGYIVRQVLSHSNRPALPIWRKIVAAVRYLSYRGFHIKALRWNSAPVGVLMLGAVGVIYFFCMDLAPRPYYWDSLDWGGSPPLATRSGWLALGCMPFVFATASKTNWITFCTGVTHEKIQVFHRWISYAFFILALMHTFPFIVYHIRFHDMVKQFTQDSTLYYWTGIVAIICQAWLTFASFSPLRNLNYEFFKASHFIAVILFIVTLFWHCNATLTSWNYFVAVAAIYVPCFLYSWLRTCFEHGVSQKARVFVEDNDFIRVAIPVKFEWTPGQHCFLRFRGFGLHVLSSHPFTICSLPSRTPGEGSEAIFYIRRGKGFTARLFNLAQKQPGVAIPVLVDGPYGGIDIHRFYNSDRLVVTAGGSGAGWCLPFIEQFARSVSAQSRQMPVQKGDAERHEEGMDVEREGLFGKVGPKSLHVILATRDTPTRVWFHRTVAKLTAKHPDLLSSSRLNVEVFLTGEAEGRSDSPKVLADIERASSSSSAEEDSLPISGEKAKLGNSTNAVQEELLGRPQLPTILHAEAANVAESKESLAVYVCGPETMQNDARNAAAKANLALLGKSDSGGVYLHLEHFSWA